MKMNTCPSPEAKRRPHIRDIKCALGVFYTLVTFIMRKLELEKAPDICPLPLKALSRVFIISGPTFYTLRIS